MSSVRSEEAAETDKHVLQCFRFVLISKLHFIYLALFILQHPRGAAQL